MATFQSAVLNTSNQYIKCQITAVEQMQVVADNLTVLRVYIEFWRTNSGYSTSGNGSITVTINGDTWTQDISSSQVIDEHHREILFDQAEFVYHNTDGTKAIQITINSLNSYRFTIAPQTFAPTLTTIPRGSKFRGISEFTMDGNPNVGNAFNVPVTKYASGFWDTLTIKIGSTVVATRDNYVDGNVVFTSNELNTIYSLISAQNYADFTFVIATQETGGWTTVGTDTAYARGWLSAQGLAPSFSADNITVLDINPTTTAITDLDTSIIKGYSTVRVSINAKASAQKGSTLGSNCYEIAGIAYASQSESLPIVRDKSSFPYDVVTVIVRDSRGNQTTVTKNFTHVQSHSVPALGGISVTRANPDLIGSNVKLKIQNGSFQTWVAGFLANTIISVGFRIRELPNGAWGNWNWITCNIGNGTFTFNDVISGTFEATKKYEIQVTANDRISYGDIVLLIDNITPTLDINADTRSIAVGKMLDGALPAGSLDTAETVRAKIHSNGYPVISGNAFDLNLWLNTPDGQYWNDNWSLSNAPSPYGYVNVSRRNADVFVVYHAQPNGAIYTLDGNGAGLDAHRWKTYLSAQYLGNDVSPDDLREPNEYGMYGRMDLPSDGSGSTIGVLKVFRYSQDWYVQEWHLINSDNGMPWVRMWHSGNAWTAWTREIESGTNANGYYVKFKDGTMLCRTSIWRPNVLFGGNDVPNVRYGSWDAIVFPYAFTAIPSVVVSNNIIGYMGFVGRVEGVSTTGFSAVSTAVGTTNVTLSYTLYYIAMGRWK